MAEPVGRIRLVTRGDDAGASRSANRAIRETFEKGILKNAGLMAPCAFVEDAAEQLGGLDGLCCGMHFAITSEWQSPRWGPVAEASRVESLLADDSCFLHNSQELNERGADVEHMMIEAQAQYEKLCDLGVNVQYLDEHMGVDWLPGLGDRLEQFAQQHGLVYNSRQLDRLPKVDVQGDKVQRVAAQLEAAGPGTYLIVGHPCYNDDETQSIQPHGESMGDKIGNDRDQERRMFLDPAVLDVVQRRGIECIRYTEIVG